MVHISSVKTMANQLEDLGVKIDDAQLLTKIVLTLPPSYRHFQSTWDMLPDTKISPTRRLSYAKKKPRTTTTEENKRKKNLPSSANMDLTKETKLQSQLKTRGNSNQEQSNGATTADTTTTWK